MPPPKERTPELRRRLLDVTIDLLAADGTAAVTTRGVATRAGASAPAIYELFGDKAGLIRAVCFDGFRRLLAELVQLPAPTGTTRDVLAAVDVFRRFSRDNPRLFEVMYTKQFDALRPDPEERALGDATRTFLVDRIATCTVDGTLHGDPTDIAHGVLAMAIGLATQESAGWLGSTVESSDRRWKDNARALLAGWQVDPSTTSAAF